MIQKNYSLNNILIIFTVKGISESHIDLNREDGFDKYIIIIIKRY